MNTQTEGKPTDRVRRIAGTLVTILVGIVLLGSASAKFAHAPTAVNSLAAIGISGNRLIFVALLETASALLFLIPALRSAGLLLVSAFLGGAIATHLQHGLPILPPSIVLGLTWFGVWLRHPQILWSWKRGPLARAVGELK